MTRSKSLVSSLRPEIEEVDASRKRLHNVVNIMESSMDTASCASLPSTVQFVQQCGVSVHLPHQRSLNEESKLREDEVMKDERRTKSTASDETII